MITASSPLTRALRDEAMRLMDGRGTILDTARDVSRLMREAGIPGVVIGGIAVVLHGHIRTTKDIDVFLTTPPEPLAELLTAHGFTFSVQRREFVRDGVPVPLVLPEQLGTPPRRFVEIEGVTTISLADLIAIKLRGGTKNLLRAQDLADVIGLIRHHRLNAGFARYLDKELRPEFRKLARAILEEGMVSSLTGPAPRTNHGGPCPPYGIYS